MEIQKRTKESDMGIIGFFKKKFRPTDSEQKTKLVTRKKLGLALGGGGARGFAHIGVLKAFEEEGLDFDYVAGTSVGSLVGCLYAYGLTADQIFEMGKAIKLNQIKPHKLVFVPSSPRTIEAMVVNHIGDITFRDLKKPFKAVAVDIYTGRELHLDYGSVAKAVSASCCVPGVFTAVPWESYLLVDGGVQNPIPSEVVRDMGAEYVVAVDINYARGQGIVREYDDNGNPIIPEKKPGVLSVLSATMRIMMKEVAVKGIINADIVISSETKRFKSTKLDGAEELFEEGYKAGKEAIARIKEAIAATSKILK